MVSSTNSVTPIDVSMNVLLIEPDETFAAEVRAEVSDPHVALEIASNGTDAWMMLATFQHTFHLVIVDLALPDIDGIDLLAKMRRSPKHRDTQVIVCTARTHRDTVANAIRHGVRHFLVKPCAPKAVVQKLRETVVPFPALAAV